MIPQLTTIFCRLHTTVTQLENDCYTFNYRPILLYIYRNLNIIVNIINRHIYIYIYIFFKKKIKIKNNWINTHPKKSKKNGLLNLTK